MSLCNKKVLWLCLLATVLLLLQLPAMETRRSRSRSGTSDTADTVDTADVVAPAPSTPAAPTPATGLLLTEFIMLVDESLNGFLDSILDAVGVCFDMGCMNGTIAECASCLSLELQPPAIIPNMSPMTMAAPMVGGK